MNNHVDEKALKLICKDVLRNKKFDILQLAYMYNKKKKYDNYNWLKDKIKEDWSIDLPERYYSSFRSVQEELIHLINMNLDINVFLPYFEWLLKTIKNKCGEYLFSQAKYKQLRFLWIKMDQYLKMPHETIQWIKKIDHEIYDSIIQTNDWTSNIHVHIDRIHTALHAFLINACKKLKIDLFDRPSIIDLYSKITKQMSNSNLKHINFLSTDAKLIKIINDSRNNNSKAHPSFNSQIAQNIGIIFLKSISLVIEKINLFIT